MCVPPGESFPRQSRLLKADDYRRVFSSNFRISDANLTILVGKAESASPRIGFAIAKKQVRRAVDRNRLKRIFRESFRRWRDRLPAHDMVVMVKKNILLVDPSDFQRDLDNHWNSIIKKCTKSSHR